MLQNEVLVEVYYYVCLLHEITVYLEKVLALIFWLFLQTVVQEEDTQPLTGF